MSNEGKVQISVHMGNYVNQIHHTINTGESREVKIKINFAWFTFVYTVIPLYNAMVGVHDIKARYKWGAL